MIIHKAYKYELDPNNKQKTLLAKHAGVARYAYNWALAQRVDLYNNNMGQNRFTTAMSQQRIWDKWRKESALWTYEVSKCAGQEAIRDLERAFNNFYKGLKSGRKVGFPKFKKKGKKDSFKLYDTDKNKKGIRTNGKQLFLPKIKNIRTKEITNVQGKILFATVSRDVDRWFVSFTVEQDLPDPIPVNGPIVGIDLGLTTFATLSDGTIIDNPKFLVKSLKRLRKANKNLSRKKKGSNNRKKAQLRLGKVHRTIRNQRKDFLHKTTTNLAKTKSVIKIEDLCVKGMIKNHNLARSISDVGWGEFRRQLEYKTKWYGSELVIVDRFFASSKTCSVCGLVVDKLDLSVRSWYCDGCKTLHNRDFNASINIMNYIPIICRKSTSAEIGDQLVVTPIMPVGEAENKHCLDLSTVIKDGLVL